MGGRCQRSELADAASVERNWKICQESDLPYLTWGLGTKRAEQLHQVLRKVSKLSPLCRGPGGRRFLMSEEPLYAIKVALLSQHAFRSLIETRSHRMPLLWVSGL